VFVGINPGMRSAAIGHHFAGYSNRFWRLLCESGLVPEELRPEDDVRLPGWGYGMTNLIPRATRGMDSLRQDEYAAGVGVLRRKIRRWQPQVVALLGLQPERLEGARVFVLPNPSGRNANYSYVQMLAAFADLRRYLHL
jgi:TDG/mug DNA glycosylase family protein